MQAPMPTGPEAVPAEGGDDSSPMKLIENVQGGLSTVASLLESSGAPPEVTQKMGQIVEEFTSLMEQLMGGGAQPPAGAAAAEQAGGNPNARPY